MKTGADGKPIMQADAEPPPTLEELLRGVTDENLHGEWDTGAAMDREAPRPYWCSITSITMHDTLSLEPESRASWPRPSAQSCMSVCSRT